jgi:hypothetical protein
VYKLFHTNPSYLQINKSEHHLHSNKTLKKIDSLANIFGNTFGPIIVLAGAYVLFIYLSATQVRRLLHGKSWQPSYELKKNDILVSLNCCQSIFFVVYAAVFTKNAQSQNQPT